MPNNALTNELLDCAAECIGWIQKYMLTFERGGWGVFERIIVSQKKRVCLCRPDTASELLVVLHDYKKLTGSAALDDVTENLIKWLMYAQNPSGGFPFSLANGSKQYRVNKTLYQNDNGKVIINFCYLYSQTSDGRFLKSAVKCADFWLKNQSPEGHFGVAGVLRLNARKGPCFVLWLMAAMFLLYGLTNERKYFECGDRAFAYIKTLIKDGRVLTSVELNDSEEWRPESSENYIALLCFALAFGATKDGRFIKTAAEIWPFCEKLIDPETGAVQNGAAVRGSLYDESPVCDLVYTEGFALNAMINMFLITQNKEYLNRALKAAAWLAKIQCGGDEPDFIRGAWRGSFDLARGRYFGICPNKAREGGEDSVYAGWSSLVIVKGMLDLVKLTKK